MFASWILEMECHHHKRANSQLDQKPLLMLASMVLPMAREPRSLVSLDSYFLLFIMTHSEMMKSLYALLFLQRALVSDFLRKIYTNLWNSGKEIRQTSGKKAASPILIQNVFLFHFYAFFSKDNISVPLSYEPFWSKSVWKVCGFSFVS